MIDEKNSNAATRTIASTDEYRFSKECILCGNVLFDLVTVPYEKAKIFFNIHWVESFSITFPLCAECMEMADEREKQRNLRFNLVALSGLALAFVPVSILSAQKIKQFPLWIEVISFFGMFLIVVAFAMMKLKSKTFPIFVRRTKSHHYFTFPDQDSMKRFLSANIANVAEKKPA